MKIFGSTPDEKFKSIETILSQIEKKKEDFKRPEPIQMPYSISGYIYSPENSGVAVLRHMFLADTSITLGVYIEDFGKGTASLSIGITGEDGIGRNFNYPLSPKFNSFDTIELKTLDRLVIKIVYDNEEQKPLGIWVTGDCI